MTLALEKGFRPEVVKEMTRHKNYATFKRYIKITNQVKKEEMNRLWGKQKYRIILLCCITIIKITIILIIRFLALEKGFRSELVIEMIVHKNYATFKRYIKSLAK